MSGRYDIELEPEVRTWLDGLPLGQYRHVTYWLAPGRRVVLLTVFVKTRPNEWAEVDRARRAKKLCETEHGAAHEIYDR
jgi:hypothetical protein